MRWLWQDYGRRADHLDLKEKELRAKEAELRKLEQDLRSTGALKPEKNWPPCCAFTHHDIAGEVSHDAHPSLSCMQRTPFSDALTKCSM